MSFIGTLFPANPGEYYLAPKPSQAVDGWLLGAATAFPAITFAGSSNAATTGGTSIALPIPATAQDGDTLVAFVVVPTPRVATMPAGWQYVGYQVSTASAGWPSCYVFQRKAASEGASVTVTLSASDGFGAVMMAFRNAGPVGLSGGSGVFTGASINAATVNSRYQSLVATVFAAQNNDTWTTTVQPSQIVPQAATNNFRIVAGYDGPRLNDAVIGRSANIPSGGLAYVSFTVEVLQSAQSADGYLRRDSGIIPGVSVVGGGGVSATLAATESADLVAATSALAIQATLSATEGSDTASAAAVLPIQATLAATEGSDTLSSSASVGSGVNADLSATEGADTVAASATLPITATASVTEGADTVAASATIAITATAAITEGADTSASAAAIALQATLAATEGADTIASAAAVALQATLAATEGADSLSASASLGGISATVAITEGADTATASATIAITATVAANENGDGLTSAAAVLITATATIAETGDSVSSSAAVTITAAMTAIEAADAIDAAAALAVQASLAAIEAADTLSASGGAITLNPRLAIAGRNQSMRGATGRTSTTGNTGAANGTGETGRAALGGSSGRTSLAG